MINQHYERENPKFWDKKKEKDITREQLDDAREQIKMLESIILERAEDIIITLPKDGQIIISGNYWQKKFLPMIFNSLNKNAISYRVNKKV